VAPSGPDVHIGNRVSSLYKAFKQACFSSM
jgi:hypothetical protein